MMCDSVVHCLPVLLVYALAGVGGGEGGRTTYDPVVAALTGVPTDARIADC